MAARIRAHDWSTTPLGPVAGWPQALRIATRILLDTRHPMLIWWGPELIQLYNDAYRDTLGPEKHPAALGGRGRDTWAEIWDGAGPQIAQVMGGGPATWHEDQLLPVTRHGSLRDAWWTYSLSPIEDGAAPNGVGGVLMVGRDVTREHVVRGAALDGEARQAFLLALSDALRPLSDAVAVQRAAMKLLAERLDVMRASYFEVDADQDGFVLTARHERDAAPIPDRMRLSDFSPAMADAYRKGRPLVFHDTEVEAEEESQREAYRAVGVRAWAAVPLVKDGLLTSIVGVHSATPRAWSSVEVRLIEDVAERTWAAVERARAEAELRRSEGRYRSLFEMMGQGYDECELIRGSDGAPVDYRILDVNPAFERILGMRAVDVLGRRVRELIPDLEDWWPTEIGRIVDAGRPETIRRGVASLGRDYEVQIYPRGGDRFAALFDDVTERRRAEAALRDSEARQAFLLEVGDVLSPLTDPAAIQGEACRLLADKLSTDRAYYVEIDEARGTALVRRDHVRGTSPSLAGTHPIASFSWSVDILRRGECHVVDDTRRSAVVPDGDRAALVALNIISCMGAPLVKGGRLVGALCVTGGAARAWSWADADLLRNVGERIWAAVERARAEAELRRSEELRRVAIEGGGMGTWRWDVAEGMIWGDATFLSLWGFPPSDAPRGFADFAGRMTAKGRNEMAAIAAKAIGPDESFDGQLEVGAGPARGRWVRWRGRADAERPTLLDGVSFDVTEQRAAERALRESEEQQRLTLQLVPAMLWWADAAGREIYSNERWKFYTGQRAAEIHDYGWLDAIHPDDVEETRAAFEKAFETGEPIERQQRIRQAGDGYRWHLVRHVPVRDGTGAILRWFGAAIDVHDLHELQDRQGVLVAELQHRTRNLMGVVQAMFEDTLRSNDDMGAFVAEIRDRLRALGRVQGLLSRLGDGGRVTFDALIRDEMRAVGAPSEGGRVTLAGPDGVSLRSSTVQTFAMAMHELATNAMKYGALKQPAGRLAVTWRLAPAGSDGRPWLHVDWHESGVAMPPDGAAPRGTGQGRQLIEQALPYQLGAITTYVMAEDGVRCSIAVPVSSRTTAEETV